MAIRLLNEGRPSRHGLEDTARHSHGMSHVHSADVITRNQSIGSRRNTGDGIVDMIRDTAQHIKWSADKKFETDLMKKWVGIFEAGADPDNTNQDANV